MLKTFMMVSHLIIIFTINSVFCVFFTIFINNFPNTLFNLKTLLLVTTVVAAGSDLSTLRMELIHVIDGVLLGC